jgi:ATP-dependent helicase/nuclease subunit B
MGLPGSGKTRACLREIMDSSGNNAVYLVPEQYSLQSEKNIVEISTGKATTVSVLSFKRLAFRVFSRAGAPRGAFLDDVGKVMLLRKITSDLRRELSFYGKPADKQGFINSLSNIISEFYQYEVSLEDLTKARDAAASEPMRAKLSDLCLIYRRYSEILRSGYFAADQALDYLPGKISGAEELCGAQVWVDGFHGFTKQERNALESIMRKAERVTVAVTVNERAVKYNPLSPYDFFYETKRAVNQITKLAEESLTEIEPPVFLNRDGNKSLDFFRRRFFRLNAGVYNKPALEIGVLTAYDRESEVEAAAREIIGTLRAQGLRFRDIAVLTGSMASYEKKIKRVFSLYGIPFFIDVRTDITRHPLVELIRAAVEAAAKRMAYEGVFRFLRTDMTGIPRSDVDALENYVLGYGVKGYQWAKRWEYGEGAEQADALRVRVLEALEPFVSGLPSKKASVREYGERIFNMLERLRVNETLTAWTEEMTSAGDNETARWHSQIWSKVCEVFDKLVETLGDSAIGVSEFGKILDAGFSASDMGIIPPSVDQVVVGDLTRSRLPSVRVLIVLGANEGMLPKPAPDTGLLNDEERVFLTERGIEVGSDGKRRNNEDRFLAYAAMSKPSDGLCLLYSRYEGGRELKPANSVDALLKMFPMARCESQAGEITPALPMLGRMGAMMRRHMSGAEMTPDTRDAYGLLKGHAIYGSALSQMENAIKSGGARYRLSDRTAGRMYGRELITGVSRLERYAECPFAYFMRYNLKARERRLYTVDQLDTGNLFHNVLEMFSRNLSEEDESWRDLTPERINDLTDICVDALSPEIPAFFSSARFKYLLTRVRRICKRSIWALSEHIKRGEFEPFGAEIAFNLNSGGSRSDLGDTPVTAIHISLNNEQKMTLTGRIDRVDIFDSGGKRYVKIIDYKSGNKKFSLSDVYFGTQLQLLLYIDALIKNGRDIFGDNCDLEIAPGGVFYFNINDPVINEPKSGVPAEESLLECFKLSGLVLADKTVVNAMDRGLEGESAVIPVSVRKTGGGFGASSSVMDSEEFNGLRASVEERIAAIGGQILSGNIEAYPYKKGGVTACDYCVFGAVCRIEADDRPNKFNVVGHVTTS